MPIYIPGTCTHIYVKLYINITMAKLINVQLYDRSIERMHNKLRMQIDINVYPDITSTSTA